MLMRAFALLLLSAVPARADVALIADIPALFIDAAIEGVEAAPDIDALYAACPAEVFESRASWWKRLTQGDTSVSFEFCKENYDRCTSLCLEKEDAKACVSMARVLENRPEEGARVASRKAHVLACALGRAGGCTNRGGGLRNRDVDGDPMQAPGAGLNACLFRTFEQSCGAGDSWGCAMSGQTYQLGEGVAADPARAIRLFEKACALSNTPEFAACVFAQERLQVLRGE